jgi:hypothetical protein
MVRLNRAQRLALKRVFDRGPITVKHEPVAALTPKGQTIGFWDERLRMADCTPVHRETTLTYRQFRKQVCPVFGGGGCVIVPWCGMWLGIEPDGYTHS